MSGTIMWFCFIKGIVHFKFILDMF